MASSRVGSGFAVDLDGLRRAASDLRHVADRVSHVGEGAEASRVPFPSSGHVVATQAIDAFVRSTAADAVMIAGRLGDHADDVRTAVATYTAADVGSAGLYERVADG